MAEGTSSACPNCPEEQWGQMSPDDPAVEKHLVEKSSVPESEKSPGSGLLSVTCHVM